MLGKSAGYAQATISNIKKADDVNKQIIKALDIASKFSQNVGRPYILIDTKQLKYSIVKENEQC